MSFCWCKLLTCFWYFAKRTRFYNRNLIWKNVFLPILLVYAFSAMKNVFCGLICFLQMELTFLSQFTYFFVIIKEYYVILRSGKSVLFNPLSPSLLFYSQRARHLRHVLNQYSRYSMFANFSHSSWKFCDVDYLTLLAWAHYFLWVFTVMCSFQFFTFVCSNDGHFHTNLLQNIHLFLGALRDYNFYPHFPVMYCCFTVGFLAVSPISILKEILLLIFSAGSDSSKYIDFSDRPLFAGF